MTANLKFLFLSLLAGGCLAFGVNGIYNLNAKNLTAQIEHNESPLTAQSQEPAKPALDLQAASVLLIKIDPTKQEQIIFAKSAEKKSPIASITKLMTAVVAAEFYQAKEKITISQTAIRQLENFGNLKPGEVLALPELLKITLIESSNDAAFALTEPMGGPEPFTALMNLKARDLKMDSSYFYSPNGLDPEDTGLAPYLINYSTARDLAKLGKYILQNHPEIIEILGQKQTALFLDDGSLHHILDSTNELLGKVPNIIAGKTGATARAGGCLLLVLRGANEGDYYIAIILNSPDKFSEMEKLLNYYGI